VAIEVVFHTGSDDIYLAVVSEDEARVWLKSQGVEHTIARTNLGNEITGPPIEEVDETELSKWLAIETLRSAVEVEGSPGFVTVRLKGGAYVSIRSDRLEAVQTSVVEGGDEDASDEGDTAEAPALWFELRAGRDVIH
jgi:hypothetical protein